MWVVEGLVRKSFKISSKVNNNRLDVAGLGQPAMESNVGSDPEIRVSELATLVGIMWLVACLVCGGAVNCLISKAAI